MDITAKQLRQHFPALTGELSGPAQESLCMALRAEPLAPGQQLVAEGALATALYLVVEGALTVTVSEGAQRLVLGQVPAGRWLGEAWMLDPGPSPVGVEAQAGSTAWVLTQARFEELRHASPLAAAELLRTFAVELASRLRASGARLPALSAEATEPPTDEAHRAELAALLGLIVGTEAMG